MNAVTSVKMQSPRALGEATEQVAPPEGEPEAAVVGNDPNLWMMALEASSSAFRMKNAEKTIEEADETRKRQAEQARQAAEAAREAGESASFWDDVASVCKVVAVAACAVAAVATGGSTLVVAAAIVGASCQVTATAGRKLGLDEGVCKGFEMASMAACVGGAGAGLFASGAASAAGAVATGARLTAGAASVGQGVATVKKGGAQAEGLRAQADGKRAEQGEVDARDRQDDARADIGRAMNDHRKVAAIAAEISNERAKSAERVIANMRG